jgi:hypothetical protein
MTQRISSKPATAHTPIPDQNQGALVPLSALARPIPSLRTAMTRARPISPHPGSRMAMSPHHVHHENSTRQPCRLQTAFDRKRPTGAVSITDRLPYGEGAPEGCLVVGRLPGGQGWSPGPPLHQELDRWFYSFDHQAPARPSEVLALQADPDLVNDRRSDAGFAASPARVLTRAASAVAAFRLLLVFVWPGGQSNSSCEYGPEAPA